MAEQTRTYYCGPTSMQMIAWGWTGREQSQEHWASRLGTTSSGSSISEMVRVTNEDTGWDRKDYAGPYIVLDIGHWSYGKWWLLNMRHVFDYKAPLILHPILLKQFYPYLDDDASGHFQVGRGYRKNGDKMNLIGFFEPWNQQRFDPSEPYISPRAVALRLPELSRQPGTLDAQHRGLMPAARIALVATAARRSPSCWP